QSEEAGGQARASRRQQGRRHGSAGGGRPPASPREARGPAGRQRQDPGMVLAGGRGAPRGEQTERPQEVHAAPAPRARQFVMFARFTPQAREAMVLAQEESARLGYPWLGTEHLLLGLLRQPGPAASNV